jgi:capsular polysaccharide biosynthesis protein
MSEVSAERHSLGLDRYLTVILRRRWVVIAMTLLGLGAAIAYLSVAPKTVTATTLVNISVISSDPFNAQRSQSDLIDSQTEQQSARSSAVLRRAAVAPGVDVTEADLRSSMDATLLANGTVMRIAYQGSSAEQARRGADAIARAYLDYRASQAEGTRNTIRDQLTTRRDELRDEIRSVNAVLANDKASDAARAKAQADLQVLTAEVGSLASQLNSLDALDTTGGAVLSTSADNPTVTSPRTWLVLATGLGAGLALGLVSAFVVNVLDRRVRDAHDVAGAKAGVVLMVAESRSGWIPAREPDLDAVNAAREQLLADFVPAGAVLSIIDLTRGHGPSDLGVNFAFALARSETPVDLLLPEWSRQDIARLCYSFGAALAHAVDGVVELPGTGVRVVVPTSSLSGAAWLPLLNHATTSPDPERCVVVVVPPAASRALRLSAGRHAQVALPIAELKATRIGELAKAAAQMRSVGAGVPGVLLAGHRRERRLERSGARSARKVRGAHADGESADAEESADPSTTSDGADLSADGVRDGSAHVEATESATAVSEETPATNGGKSSRQPAGG